MRRLTIEVSAKDLPEIEKNSFQNLESVEMLHILKQDLKEFAAICKIKFKASAPTNHPFFGARNLVQAQLLEKTRDGSYTYFIKSKISRGHYALFRGIDGFVIVPFEFKDGKFKITFVGSASAVRKFLQRASKSRLPFKIKSLTDARFSDESALNRMTERQRKVLLTAFNLGYYSIPKKITSEELARNLDMKSSTLIIHRIKAERHVIQALLEEENTIH